MSEEVTLYQWLKLKMIESEENYKGTAIKENYGVYTFNLDDMLCKITYWYPKEVTDGWRLSEEDVISVTVASGEHFPFQLRREDFKTFLEVVDRISKKE